MTVHHARSLLVMNSVLCSVMNGHGRSRTVIPLSPEMLRTLGPRGVFIHILKKKIIPEDIGEKPVFWTATCYVFLKK